MLFMIALPFLSNLTGPEILSYCVILLYNSIELSIALFQTVDGT